MASITIVFDVVMCAPTPPFLFVTPTNPPHSMLTPFPMLLKTQLPMRKKVILLGIFSLGTFITIIQIVRILTIKSLANYIDSSELIMWSMVENNLGIVVASIPPLSPLVRSLRDRSANKSSSAGPVYALNSSRGFAKGSVPLGSGIDKAGGRDSRENTLVSLGDLESSSEELSAPGGIYKTTQFVVSRQSSGGSLEDEGRKQAAPYLR